MKDAATILHYVDRAGKDVFDEWLSDLDDSRAQAKIAARLKRIAAGNFGDSKSLGQGLWELRIDWGPGYRVYFAMVGRSPFCFSAAETNVSSLWILRERLNI